MQIHRRHLVSSTACIALAWAMASAIGCGSSKGSPNTGGSTAAHSSSATTTSSSSSAATTSSSTSSGAGGSGGMTASSSSGAGGGMGGATASSSTSTSTSSSSGTGGMANPNACMGMNGTACTLNGTSGLCEGMICSACNDPTDDATCKAAYPPAALCLAGVCTPGDCRTDADCTTGQICGVSVPNTCGKCTKDAQCKGDTTYGANTICNTTTGLCVSNACTTNDAKCTANAKDFCCTAKCVPGSCCVTADCTGANETCKNNQCTTCALPTTGTYYVDPLNGNDGTGTGSSATGGACDFQTITRALEFIGPSPAAGTTIAILNTGTAGAAETFPISVPANVTITGAVAGTPANVVVPATVDGFVLAAPLSGLTNLKIGGTNGTSGNGVVVSAGSASSTTIANVEIQNTGAQGILVTGVLTIGSGVNVHNAGTTANAKSGMAIQGSGQVLMTLNTATNDTAAQFSNNTAAGIAITGKGSLTVAGTLDPVLTLDSNANHGLFIQQTPGTPPPNVVSNVHFTNTVTGSGITIYGGSSLKLRNSITRGNKNDGIVLYQFKNTTTTSDDMSQIDLGTATDAGGNMFQYATGNMPNGSSGICLAIGAMAGQTLNAAGNKFEAANCANAATTLVHTAGACAAGSDYGIVGATTTNKITLTKCM
jgi:hypothetical protein